MIPHTLLADSIIILLPEGPITRTREQFNFNSIVQVAKSGTIEDLRQLLAPVDCPDGVYHLYLGSTLFVLHSKPEAYDNVQLPLALYNGKFVEQRFSLDKLTYLGPYTSLQAIQDNHPEYFI